MAYKRAQKIGLGTALFFALFLALSSYFAFAAIQGDYEIGRASCRERV